jgi:drug/metabolite transporter (DMT)-like permease
LKPLDLLELVTLAALWGASFLFMRIATPEFGPIVLIEIRTLIAALFLIPIAFLARKTHLLLPNAGRLILVGLIGTAIPFCLLSYATLYASAGYTSILNATTPIFTALIAWLWVSERLTVAAMIGLVIGFIGVIVLSFDKQPGGGEISLLPIMAAMGATLCYGFSSNYARQKLQHIHPLALACGSQISAALLLMPISLWFWPQQMPGTESWVSVTILGIACTASAFILYFRLIAKVGVNKTVAVTYLIPFFGVVWGMLFLGEVLSHLMMIGALLILTGVSLTTGVIKISRKS